MPCCAPSSNGSSEPRTPLSDEVLQLAERHAGHSNPDDHWSRDELHLERLGGG